MIKPEDCSKGELVMFIKQSMFYNQLDFEYQILSCRIAIAHKKASEENRNAINALEDYASVMKPYDGKCIGDIPYEIIRKAESSINLYGKHEENYKSYSAKRDRLQDQIDALFVEMQNANE